MTTYTLRYNNLSDVAGLTADEVSYVNNRRITKQGTAMNNGTLSHDCPSEVGGLTADEVVRTIYRDDGADYRLVPKMIEDFDDEGNSIGEHQAIDSMLGLVWRVELKNSHGKWEDAPFEYFGKTEDEAESEFLADAFKNNRWKDTWFVQSDEEAKLARETLR